MNRNCECGAHALWLVEIAIPSSRGVAYRRVRACTRCADKLAGEMLRDPYVAVDSVEVKRLPEQQYCEDDDCRVCGKPKRPMGKGNGRPGHAWDCTSNLRVGYCGCVYTNTYPNTDENGYRKEAL